MLCHSPADLACTAVCRACRTRRLDVVRVPKCWFQPFYLLLSSLLPHLVEVAKHSREETLLDLSHNHIRSALCVSCATRVIRKRSRRPTTKRRSSPSGRPSTIGHHEPPCRCHRSTRPPGWRRLPHVLILVRLPLQLALRLKSIPVHVHIERLLVYLPQLRLCRRAQEGASDQQYVRRWHLWPCRFQLLGHTHRRGPGRAK